MINRPIIILFCLFFGGIRVSLQILLAIGGRGLLLVGFVGIILYAITD